MQTVIAVPVAHPRAEANVRRIAGVATVLLGAALIFLVGFAASPAVHNGTHDTRHANGFPCH
jgi:cobalt transporter subunit CbtB